MKKLYSLTIAILLGFMSFINADSKNAIIMNKVEYPIAGMVSIIGAKNAEAARKSMGSEGSYYRIPTLHSKYKN